MVASARVKPWMAARELSDTSQGGRLSVEREALGVSPLGKALGDWKMIRQL
jgi:hypothetical protein